MMKKNVFLSLVVSLLFCHTVQANQTGDVQSIDFKGQFTLLPPCTVNNDQVIDVSFGNIGVEKVDGVRYKKLVPYTVTCFGSKDDSPINLKISTSAETFDSAAMVTSADGLGIQIQINGQPMPLNIPLVTTMGELSTVELSAVPVKDPNKTLTAQTFTAAATLTAEYE